MSLQTELLILLTIIGSITVFLFLGEKVKISAISIELILGMILGNFVFGVVPGFPPISALEPGGELFWLYFLSDFGFILLMFLAGLELNVLFLKKYFKKSMVLVLSIFIISFIPGLLVGFVLELELAAAFLIGIVFAGVSIGIVFPLLHELGLSSKRIGQILITATMILDVVCILIISIIEFASVGEFSILQFTMTIVIIVLFFIFILYGIGPFWRYMEGRTSEVKALEWEIRITFAVVLVLAVMTGFLLQIEAIIGAFLAGMIMGQSRSAHRLEEKIGSIGYGFFIPIFFFVIGMGMKIDKFTDPYFVGTLVIVVLAIFAVKIGSSLIGSKIIGYNLKTSLIIGFIMVPSLSVGIAAAQLGFAPGAAFANDFIFTLLIAIIVVSSIIIPILTRISAQKLIPNLITTGSVWHIHLEHDLGIYLDDFYHSVFDELTVKGIPTMDVIRIHPETPAIAILGYMEKFHQMNFPVVSEDNKLIGIVDFDDVKDFIIDNKFHETARSIMLTELIYITPEESLNSALNKMKATDLELLPVVEAKTLNFLGTINRDAILRFVRIRALGHSISPADRDQLSRNQDRVWTKDRLKPTREP
jgi:Kef-type K+ transport system membrane component KefB/CBS domain-containing protein